VVRERGEGSVMDRAPTACGGGDADMMDTFKTWTCKGLHLQVSFGDDDDYVLLMGRNSSCMSSSLDDDLISRLGRIHKCGKTIEKVCLFPGGAYFVSDDEGTEWKAMMTTWVRNSRMIAATPSWT